MLPTSFRRKVPVTLQMEAAECGTACLAMVLGFYGHRRHLSDLREICGTSRDGNSAAALLQAAQRLGLQGRGVATDFEGLQGLTTPAILHWNKNHFVVLQHCVARSISIVDPGVGRLRLTPKEARKAYSGVALELSPSETFVRRSRETLSYRRYWGALRRFRWPLFFIIIASFLEQMVGTLAPTVTQLLIDHVVLPGRTEWLLSLVATLVFASGAGLVFQGLQGRGQAILQGTVGVSLTVELGRRLLALPLPFLQSRSQGDLLARVEAQSQLRTALTNASRGVFDLVYVVLLTAMMLAYDLRLGLISLSLSFLRVVVVSYTRRSIIERSGAHLAAAGREQAVLAEAVSAPELLVGLSALDRVLGRYRSRVADRIRTSLSLTRLQLALSQGLAVMGGAMHAFIFWLGGGQVVAGQMTVGAFVGFLAIRALIEQPLGALVGLLEDWAGVGGALERSDDLLRVAPAREGSKEASALSSQIELRHLGFRYGTGAPWLFRDVNLVVKRGEHIAIVGSSGEGKSTLGQLVVGLLTPTEGQVLWDHVDISSFSRDTLAKELAVVSGGPLTLGGSLRAAVTLRNPAASDDAVERAIRLARLEHVVAKLPRGYDTQLEVGGRNLSGGERQRLALAQALLEAPAVLVLDEATSALDKDTEAEILASIRSTRTTVVSVTHSQAVVEQADRVFQLGEGNLRAFGQHHLVGTTGCDGPEAFVGADDR